MLNYIHLASIVLILMILMESSAAIAQGQSASRPLRPRPSARPAKRISPPMPNLVPPPPATEPSLISPEAMPPGASKLPQPVELRPKQPEVGKEFAPEPDEEKIFDENTILIRPPQLQALITINESLNPLGLDAENSATISLRDALKESLVQNLDIGISGMNEGSQKWDYVNSLTKFLPDALTSYNWQYLRGRINLPPGLGVRDLARLSTPFIITTAGFRYYGYQGGKVVFGALQSKHNYKAAKMAKKATISDVLQDVSRKYYDLLLSQAILQIRIKAVQTSEAQLKQNRDLNTDGLATNLDVLQSRTQLARDRQSLIDQQITRRSASVQLAHTLNAGLAVDLVPDDRLVHKVRLISDKMKIQDLLKLAIDHRPELKQYEELRLAAKRAIVVAAAPLQPKVSLQGNVYGIGPTLGRDLATVPPSFAPVALAAPPVTAPIAGLATAGVAGAPGVIPVAATAVPAGAVLLPPHPFSTQVAALYTLSFRVDWNFNNMGASDFANIQAAKYTARQAHLQANKELIDVLEQVRLSYLSSLGEERRIEETSAAVASSGEALRLAQLRFQNGLGTNIDIIQAQRDYTQALTDKAQAIINFNKDQIQLLHDTGMISVDTLTASRPLEQ